MNDIKRITKNKKGFTLAELLIVVAIIGVLVAISIPIFTSQLRKARLATNQANARAAYAAAVADALDANTDTSTTKSDDGKTTTSTNLTYTYTVSTAKVEKKGTAATGNTDIASWTVDTEISSKKLGDATAKAWVVTIDPNGGVVGINATWTVTTGG